MAYGGGAPTPRRNSLYLLTRRSIQARPLHTPTNRPGFGDKDKEADRHILDPDGPGNSAVRHPISLVAVRDDSEGDNLGNVDIDSLENET